MGFYPTNNVIYLGSRKFEFRNFDDQQFIALFEISGTKEPPLRFGVPHSCINALML